MHFIFLLQNLLTSNPGLAAVFASKERLTPLFECLALPVPPESNIPQICLSVLSLLTKHAPCLEAMVAERTSLICFSRYCTAIVLAGMEPLLSSIL